MGEKIGYIRVSTQEQNTERQEVLMQTLGVDSVYIDTCSGKNKERPQLKAMMAYVRKGDTVIVESISRFARNTRDLLDLVDQLTKKKVEFFSQKENIDTSTPTGRFMLAVFGALADMEQETLLERQREGIAIAKSKGIYKGRVPIKIDKKKFDIVYKEWKAGHITAKKAMSRLDLKANTFYRRVKEYEANNS